MDRSKLLKLTFDITCFMNFKMKVTKNPKDIDESVLSRSLVENMRKTIWVERHIASADMSYFFKQHGEVMSSRMDLRIVYLLYICFIVKECYNNAYEVLIRTMTILFTVATYVDKAHCCEALAVSATMFTYFFEEILSDIERQGGFEKLETYLERRETPKLYSKLEKLEEAGATAADIFKQLNLQTSVLKIHLDEGTNREDIEGHGQTRNVFELILDSGLGDIREMVCHNVMHAKDLPNYCRVGNDSQAAGGSEKQISAELPGKDDSSKTGKIAYLKAHKVIREFQEKCKHLELLLDFVFKDSSSNDEQ